MQQMVITAMILSEQMIHKPNTVTLNVRNQTMNRYDVSFVKKLKDSVRWQYNKPVDVLMMMNFQFFFILVNQAEVVVRTCHWEKKFVHPNDCYNESINSNGTSHGKILFCETCDTDGCNTASVQYQSIVKLISSICIIKFVVFSFWHFVATKMSVKHK